MPFNKDRLVALRTERKQTRHRVAWQTFIDPAVLQRIEEGNTKNPRFNTIKTLADYFNVSVDSFRKGTIEISECLYLIEKN